MKEWISYVRVRIDTEIIDLPYQPYSKIQDIPKYSQTTNVDGSWNLRVTGYHTMANTGRVKWSYNISNKDMNMNFGFRQN